VRLFFYFGIHPSLIHNISTEDRYRLVQLDSNPNAQADTLITMPFPAIKHKIRDLRLSFTDPALTNHLYWTANGTLDKFSIIVFPGEFNKDDVECNMNQLIMVFTTAQAQRRALSLENSVIMGATSGRGRVRIYSSYWDSEDDTVTSRSISVFNNISFLLRSSAFMNINNNSISQTL
jgi:hypothetical protein